MLLRPTLLTATVPTLVAPNPAATDPGMPMAHYLIGILSVALVVICVLLHYEVLRKLSAWLSRLHQLHRTRVLVLILGLLLTHLIEIWIYALGIGLLDAVAGFGRIMLLHDPAAAKVWLEPAH